MTFRRISNRGVSAARKLLFASVLLGTAPLAMAESKYAAAWGPAVGATAPLLAASDQHGKAHTLSTLAGTNGLLFVFNRSVDW